VTASTPHFIKIREGMVENDTSFIEPKSVQLMLFPPIVIHHFGTELTQMI
jgi:hypothetical protein